MPEVHFQFSTLLIVRNGNDVLILCITFSLRVYFGSCYLYLYNFTVGVFRWRLLAMRIWYHRVYQYLIHDMLRSWPTWLLHCVMVSLSSR